MDPHDSSPRERWARGLMVAILAVVCPRQILFWVSGVGAVEVPKGVLLWADGLIGAATAIVMTGGQMYLVHHLTGVVLTARRSKWRLVLGAVLAWTWVVVIGVTIIIGSAHVVMQVAREPLLRVLELDWMLSHGATWLVGVTTVTALELTAAGLALAHADSLARALDAQVREAESSKDEVLRERNRLADELALARNRLRDLEEQRSSPPDASEGSSPRIRVPCRRGCGWTSKLLPEDRARRAERAHFGRHRKETSD